MQGFPSLRTIHPKAQTFGGVERTALRRLPSAGLLFCLTLSGCGTSATQVDEPIKTFEAPSLEDRPLLLEPGTATLRDGSSLNYERGVLTVPVRRSAEGGQTLELEFHRFFANEPSDTPPIVQLKGGPGFEGFGEMIKRPGHLEFYVLPFIRAADLVIVAHRGFGTSGEISCPNEPSPLSYEDAIQPDVRRQVQQGLVKECRSLLEAKGVELEGYSALEMAADAMEIARALDYDTVQLLGSSFGTHIGMTALRLYPELISRATFNALEGPDHTYDNPTGVWTALERIAQAAERSGVFDDRTPPEGFATAYRKVLEKAEMDPLEVEVTVPDTDRRVTLRLGPKDLAALPFMGGTQFSFRWPAWIANLSKVIEGDIEEEATELLWRYMHPRVSSPAFYQLDCGSGISAERDALYRADPARRLVRSADYEMDCPVWGADLGPAFRADFTTEVPALLLHGDHDTSTPYSNLVDLLPSFENRRVVTVRGGSHGAILEAMDDPEFVDQLVHWFATGDSSKFPPSVRAEPVPWERAR